MLLMLSTKVYKSSSDNLQATTCISRLDTYLSKRRIRSKFKFVHVAQLNINGRSMKMMLASLSCKILLSVYGWHVFAFLNTKHGSNSMHIFSDFQPRIIVVARYELALNQSSYFLPYFRFILSKFLRRVHYSAIVCLEFRGETSPGSGELASNHVGVDTKVN